MLHKSQKMLLPIAMYTAEPAPTCLGVLQIIENATTYIYVYRRCSINHRKFYHLKLCTLQVFYKS